MCLINFQVFEDIFKNVFLFLDLPWERDHEFVLQTVSGAVIGSFQCFQTLHFVVYFHLFTDKWITRCNRFYFCVG